MVAVAVGIDNEPYIGRGSAQGRQGRGDSGGHVLSHAGVDDGDAVALDGNHRYHVAGAKGIGGQDNAGYNFLEGVHAALLGVR